MVGGYQIIDLNDFVLDSGVYYPKKYFKPDIRKPIRLQGLKGKSTTNPDVESVSVWKEFKQDNDGDGLNTQYFWDDETQNQDKKVSVNVQITDYDYAEGNLPYPIYCTVTLTDNEE